MRATIFIIEDGLYFNTDAEHFDGCAEEGHLLTPALSKPKTITKAQIQRCISKLSPHWDDDQLEAVVSLF